MTLRPRGANGVALARLAAMTVTPRRRGVYYGRPNLPAFDETSWGGIVKFQLLATALPNTRYGWDVLYLGSSTMTGELERLLRVARLRRAAVVWNQNGVGYRAWHGPGFEPLNARMAAGLVAADHVFFQSEFCRIGAEKFVGTPTGSWEVLHNPVDTERLRPPDSRSSRPLTLLLGGNQYERYRVEVALETLAHVRRSEPTARLIVTGRIRWSGDPELDERTLWETARRLGVDDAIELVGSYSQNDALDVLRRGDVLLHTKVNDPCPTVVLEAMACGLPVVYSATGGTPELVGDDAGIGVPGPLDWEELHRPDPVLLAEGVLRVAAELDELGRAARERAAARFDLGPWIARHRDVFDSLRR